MIITYCLRSSVNLASCAAIRTRSLSLSLSLLECRALVELCSSTPCRTSSSISSCCFKLSCISCVSSTRTSPSPSKGTEPGEKLSLESRPISWKVVRTDCERVDKSLDNSLVFIAYFGVRAVRSTSKCPGAQGRQLGWHTSVAEGFRVAVVTQKFLMEAAILLTTAAPTPVALSTHFRSCILLSVKRIPLDLDTCNSTTAIMITKFLTSVTTSFSPFNARSGKTARTFLALLPPNARKTMAVNVTMLPRTSAAQTAALELKFSTSKHPRSSASSTKQRATKTYWRITCAFLTLFCRGWKRDEA